MVGDKVKIILISLIIHLLGALVIYICFNYNAFIILSISAVFFIWNRFKRMDKN